MPKDYDFSGWATKNDILCSDGRIIKRDAFIDQDGEEVSLVYGHKHGLEDIIGHALLENRKEGVYAYCSLNDTPKGKIARELLRHGDIKALSIYANGLKQRGAEVVHGIIRELSLVIAGANSGAYIDNVVSHSDDYDDLYEIFMGTDGAEIIAHSAEDEDEEKETKPVAEQKKVNPNPEEEEDEEDDGETVKDVLDTLNDKQKKAVAFVISAALKEQEDGDDEDEEDDEEDEVEHSGMYDEGDYMKHNVFDNDDYGRDVITHSDQEAILNLAKTNNVGSFQSAMEIYAEDNLQHGIDDIEQLFPDYEDVYKGEPETFKRDQSWVGSVMNGVHKAPYARVRTRFADARAKELRAKGYIKGDRKTVAGNIKLLQRTTDPQTIYRKDALERDDILDITDFDVVNYQYKIMRENLEEDIALAILIGDDREDTDREQIKPEHVRPIWKDDDLYTIKAKFDFNAFKAELQGDDTSKHFGENFIWAEGMVQTILYAKEKYKGSGNLAMYCTPHFVNRMLLARDMNGRRIYSNMEDLKAALNVSEIHTIEQFEGRTRTTEDNKTMKLDAILVNLKDYQVGSVKGGEITKFQQFDIDFNQEKMLLETRISGALIKPWAAIAIEEEQA